MTAQCSIPSGALLLSSIASGKVSFTVFLPFNVPNCCWNTIFLNITLGRRGGWRSVGAAERAPAAGAPGCLALDGAHPAGRPAGAELGGRRTGDAGLLPVRHTPPLSLVQSARVSQWIVRRRIYVPGFQPSHGYLTMGLGRCWP